MNAENHGALLRQLANELPALARQAGADSAESRTAAVLRLNELAALLAPYRATHRATPQRGSRRAVRSLSLPKGAGAGVFAGWAIKGDD